MANQQQPLERAGQCPRDPAGPFQSKCLNQDLPDERILRMDIPNPAHPFILIILIQTTTPNGDFGKSLEARILLCAIRILCAKIVTSGCSAVASALRSGRRGRWFESTHPDQFSPSFIGAGISPSPQPSPSREREFFCCAMIGRHTILKRIVRRPAYAVWRQRLARLDPGGGPGG